MKPIKDKIDYTANAVPLSKIKSLHLFVHVEEGSTEPTDILFRSKFGVLNLRTGVYLAGKSILTNYGEGSTFLDLGTCPISTWKDIIGESSDES